MKRILASLILSSAIFVVPSQSTLADPITVPTGLSPGEQYRLAFVTSTTTDATSSDISYYNNFVTTAANSNSVLAALGTTWTAIGSTATVAAEDNTLTNPGVDPSYPIYNLGGQLVASGNTALWSTEQVPSSNDLVNPINFFPDGTSPPSGVSVWTGTTPSGTSVPPVPGPYYALGEYDPASGVSNRVDAGFIDFAAAALNVEQLSLYGISGVLTYEPVSTPEPATITMLVSGFLTAGGFGLYRRRRRGKAPESTPAN